MITYVLVLCVGLAADSPCATFESDLTLYESKEECLEEADWLTTQVEEPHHHVQCVRYEGREIYTYLDITKG